MLDRIDRIRSVSFEWNDEAESSGGVTAGERHVGVIAQDVEAVFPELVSTLDDGHKSISYTNLTAVLVEGIKELKAENDALRQKVEALERRTSSPGRRLPVHADPCHAATYALRWLTPSRSVSRIV